MAVVEIVTNKQDQQQEEMTHFNCCDHDNVRVCDGSYDPWDGMVVDEVDCVVCNHLSDADYCPVYGECRYERDD